VLIADTNILVRCSRGKAMRRVLALRERGVALATTESNAHEMWRVLVGKLGLDADDATSEVGAVLDQIGLVPWSDYAALEPAASRRLREGGKSDWPALAASLALGWPIWSDDVDYFGVGVPVWSTDNIDLIASEESPNG
jgi:predicted nucleic acid-binding protein